MVATVKPTRPPKLLRGHRVSGRWYATVVAGFKVGVGGIVVTASGVVHSSRALMVRRLLFSLAAALAAFVLSSAGSLAAVDANADLGRTTILFAGGYGSSLDSATRNFGSLRAALAARDASLSFAQFSYTGWSTRTCAPLDYFDIDTAQDFELSKQRFLDTVASLHDQCGAQRIMVIGHSLGGLVAFHALSEHPIALVSDIVTVDSPLGGAPETEIQACVNYGLCADGPVGTVLSNLHRDWSQTAADNAGRVNRLLESGTRVTAWGNKSDCLYAPSVCVPVARALVGAFDVRDTQWLGVERTMQRDYAPRMSLASIISSHLVLLTNGASDIAADLVA